MTQYDHPIRFPKRLLVSVGLAASVGLAGTLISGCGGSGDSYSGANGGSDSGSSSSTTGTTTAPTASKPSDASGTAPPNLPSASTGSTPVAVGPVAPLFTLPQVGGGKLSLASLKGKVVLLDFWATWCVPCMAELPDFEQLYTKYKG
nr:TlpA family protein disulfide reductase [Armatimonadota bacterium]